ncbi:MAG: branched-chain amino acid ABC transporter permease [Desulfobacteraceae bacterium]|nr:branched-chain amino acid ABC transporter permease [Desulfobacteraceae bacterium]
MNRKNRWVLFLTIFVIILLWICPLFLPSFVLYLLNETLIYGLFSYGFYLLFSQAGYLSFGQAAYFAVGAYSVALMYKHVTLTIWLPFLTVIIVTALVATVLGFLSVRLGTLYFAFLTLAFAQMIYAIVFRWTSFTGGDDGLPGVPRGLVDIGFLKIDLESPLHFYYFTLLIFIVLVFVLRKLVTSSFGLTLRSIRDNIERTSFIGVNPQRYLLVAFVISSIYCAIAGALHASLTKMAYPELSYWSTSAEPIIMTLIGGIYTFSGPFFGAAIYIFLKTYLMTIIGNWVLFLGIILLIMVLFFRKGVMGFIEEKWGVKL